MPMRNPIIFLNIQSDQRSLLELTEIAENVFKERLQTINGVSEIRIWGSKKYSMRLWMDPNKLAAYQLTPLDVRNALARQNVELPSGSVEGFSTELTVRTVGRLTNPAEFNDLILFEEGGRIVRFRDVGYAELGPENLRTVLKRDGIPMVGNAIIPQPGSNHIEIAEEFYKRLERIKKDLPPDIKLGIGFDTTRFIQESIDEVEQTIFLAFGLVVLIIFLFLRDWRTTLIPVVVIPISLVGSFFVMYLAGFSINVLTLLGVVLAIGLVVDDAIVVLGKYLREDRSRYATLAGCIAGDQGNLFCRVGHHRSAGGCVYAGYLPGRSDGAFVSGVWDRHRGCGDHFFVCSAYPYPYAFCTALEETKAAALVLSSNRTFFCRLDEGYGKWLDGFLRVRWLAFVLMVVAGGMIYYFGGNLPSELAPWKTDRDFDFLLQLRKVPPLNIWMPT
jgi:multidrug efflux pump